MLSSPEWHRFTHRAQLQELNTAVAVSAAPVPLTEELVADFQVSLHTGWRASHSRSTLGGMH